MEQDNPQDEVQHQASEARAAAVSSRERLAQIGAQMGAVCHSTLSTQREVADTLARLRAMQQGALELPAPAPELDSQPHVGSKN